jgi:hypothetical protein
MTVPRGTPHHVELWVPSLERATLLFADRHPFAGGPDHYAASLEDGDGFEVELVAGIASP